MQNKDKILILCIDRDNDIGEKTNFKGPLIGKDIVLKGATELGLTDPEDSDFNTMFQTLKVFEEIKKKYVSEVAVLTGDKNVGLASDKEITDQLNYVLKHFPANYVVLVTDGAEDENVIPIIQSKVPIMSVNRVIVKQSEKLESTYYKIKDFISESLENPKLARLVFGLPAVVLILYALFGIEGWRVIVGVFGVYLLIKGLRLGDYIINAYNELATSFTRRRLAFFLYMIAIIFLVIASFRGYTAIEEWGNIGIFEASAAFTSASIYFYFLSGAIAWIGSSIGKKRNWGKVLSVIIFSFAISIVIYNAAELILNPQISIFNFIFSIILGFVLLFLALVIEWKR